MNARFIGGKRKCSLVVTFQGKTVAKKRLSADAPFMPGTPACKGKPLFRWYSLPGGQGLLLEAETRSRQRATRGMTLVNVALFVAPRSKATTTPSDLGTRGGIYRVYGTARLKSPNLSLRTWPKKTSRLLVSMPDGTLVKKLRAHPNKWWKVQILSGKHRGKTGWAYSRFMRK